MTLAPVALTGGEPAGIGPEVAAKAWSALRRECPFFWIGDPRALPEGTVWREIVRPSEAERVMPDALPVLPHRFAGSTTPGIPDPANAACVIQAIARAVDLAMSGDVPAICTCPISKIALKEGAGFAFPGHTEYLARLSGARRCWATFMGPACSWSSPGLGISRGRRKSGCHWFRRSRTNCSARP